MTYRSITHGTCALGGKHPKGSDYARECPVLKRMARVGQARKAAQRRWAPILGPRQHGTGQRGRV